MCGGAGGGGGGCHFKMTSFILIFDVLLCLLFDKIGKIGFKRWAAQDCETWNPLLENRLTQPGDMTYFQAERCRVSPKSVVRKWGERNLEMTPEWNSRTRDKNGQNSRPCWVFFRRCGRGMYGAGVCQSLLGGIFRRIHRQPLCESRTLGVLFQRLHVL